MVQSKDHILDAIIVGAGFSGIYTLRQLQATAGLSSILVLEAGSDIGGTWHWNNYPGARSDCDFDVYQFNQPELYNTFDFKERFPSRDEIIRYFNHVDKTFNLRKDIKLNTTVKEAEFDPETNLWSVKVKTEKDGGDSTLQCRYLFLCTGFTCKPFIPKIQGLEKFKGLLFHTSRWPKGRQVEWKGKRVAVVGTGASGVQVIEQAGPVVDRLTIYQRTPNLCMPMKNRPLVEREDKNKVIRSLDHRYSTFAGMGFDWNPLGNTTKEERLKIYEACWNEGGCNLWLGTYIETLFQQELNDEVYEFWAEKIRARIQDGKKKDLLAPLKQPHPFGTKYASLEQTFYDVCNQENVEIIDISQSPILEITEAGIKTEKDGVVEADIIVLATGYDTNTGAMLDINVKNKGSGLTLQEKWNGEGTRSWLGVSVNGFPNMFYTYGAQGPTALCNAPSCIEVQSTWISQLIKKAEEEGKKRIECSAKAEVEWTQKIKAIWEMTLFPKAKSYFSGCNIPGRKVEPLNFPGGFPAYIQELKDCKDKGYEGFIFSA